MTIFADDCWNRAEGFDFQVQVLADGQWRSGYKMEFYTKSEALAAFRSLRQTDAERGDSIPRRVVRLTRWFTDDSGQSPAIIEVVAHNM